MRKKMVIKISVFVLMFIITAGVVQAAYSTYISSVGEETEVINVDDDKGVIEDNSVNASLTENNDIEDPGEVIIENPGITQKKEVNIPGQATTSSANEAVKMGKPLKKEPDISRISLSRDIENVIKQKDNKNAQRHITNYKKLLAGLDVPDSYRNAIEKLLKKGYAPSEIFIAYEYLYENYGLIGELEGLLEQNKSKNNWAVVFSQYSAKNPEYVPGDFKTGYLEELMKDPDIQPDDITIADRLSQKNLKKFEELIELKKSGSTWKDIKTNLGVVNTEEMLPRYSITSAMVKKFMNDTGLSEDKVLDLLVTSGKLGRGEDEIVQMAKKGEKKQEIFAQVYEERYR